MSFGSTRSVNSMNDSCESGAHISYSREIVSRSRSMLIEHRLGRAVDHRAA